MSEVKVYKATHEMYEGWDISEAASEMYEGLDTDCDHLLVLKSDFDKVKKQLEKCKAALHTIMIGVNPEPAEYSETYKDYLHKPFTGQTASEYAKKQLEELAGVE